MRDNTIDHDSHIPFVPLQNARRKLTPGCIGELLEHYRNYLRLLASMQLNAKVRVRASASDVVQETFLEAHQAFSQFRGTTEAELIAWLRKILVRNILDEGKRQRAAKRDVNREQSLDAALDRSSEILGTALCSQISSPSQKIAKREQAVLVADAIARLSVEQRDIIIERQVHRKPFDEIATLTGKTSAAVRMSWLRALEKLKIHLNELSHE